jgi:hypothetical protein
MREPLPPEQPDAGAPDSASDGAGEPTADEPAPPMNRAARRAAKAGKPVPGTGLTHGSVGPALAPSRSPKGRRINPVRRAG